jgi:hypothetical protein
MPYFQRKPYAETVARGTATSPSPADSAATDILDMAADVLARETPGNDAYGPFRLRQTVPAGQTGAMVLGMMPESGLESALLRLLPGDFVGPAGRIPASAVTLDPPVLQLESGAGSDLRITIAAPVGTLPGLYSGLLTSVNDPAITIRIEVPVGA